MKKNTKIIDAFFKIYIKQEFTLVCGNPTPEGGGVTWQGPGTMKNTCWVSVYFAISFFRLNNNEEQNHSNNPKGLKVQISKDETFI